MQEEVFRFFVYGTLKKAHGNHGVLGNSIFLGEAVTNSKEFNMYDGGFPFVSVNRNDEDNLGCIVGELYETYRKDIANNLDRLEGYPALYDKREIDVTTLEGVVFTALIYVASEGSNNRLKDREAMKPVGRAKLLEWN